MAQRWQRRKGKHIARALVAQRRLQPGLLAGTCLRQHSCIEFIAERLRAERPDAEALLARHPQWIIDAFADVLPAAELGALLDADNNDWIGWSEGCRRCVSTSCWLSVACLPRARGRIAR